MIRFMKYTKHVIRNIEKELCPHEFTEVFLETSRTITDVTHMFHEKVSQNQSGSMQGVIL